MMYNDKPREEIAAILEKYVDSVKTRNGLTADLSDLREWASKKINQKIEESRESSFGHFSTISLQRLVSILSSNEVEQIQLDASQEAEVQSILESENLSKKATSKRHK